MSRFNDFGNALYSGERSIDFIRGRRRWFAISAVLLALALSGLGVRGLNLGLEFRGGSEVRVSQAKDLTDYESRAQDAVGAVVPGAPAKVTKIGAETIRVQTEELTEAQNTKVGQALGKEFGSTEVTTNFIGPSWGASVSKQALRALVVFVILVALVMGLYFRTWTMAVAALVALLHDMVATIGIYALSGFEVSPATMIGFLTVLGYSLYDTVVVFDKVRENTTAAFATGRRTYDEAANRAVNQTIVRSINTTVVALLPIAAVLAVGFARIGPGTLLDLSLALFIGMAVGAYSSIFLATPILAMLRARDPKVVALRQQVAAREAALEVDGRAADPVRQRVETVSRAERRGVAPAAASVAVDENASSADGPDEGTRQAPPAGADEDATLTGRKVHRWAQEAPAPRRARTNRRTD